MKLNDLPQRWKDKVTAYLEEKNESREYLTISDFSFQHKAVLKFPDGSYAEFKYPMIIRAPELREVAVFTEHCGYHIFPLGDLDIELVKD